MHILLITSDPHLVRCLQGENYHVRFTVAQAAAAETMMSVRRFDAVVLDLRRLDDDPRGTVRRLRCRSADRPVIAVGACHGPRERVQLLEAGADDCLSHPVDVEELLTRIRVRLRGHVAQVASFQFTPAENRLAKLLVSGYSLRDAAAELGVSINTVRSELKRLFEKTGTSRQADLVRVLLGFRARVTPNTTDWKK